MKRGTVVKNKNSGEYSIFLVNNDGIAKVAIVEDLYNEFEAEFIPKITMLKNENIDDLEPTEQYPNYFNSISIT